jgi:uncharacterized protein
MNMVKGFKKIINVLILAIVMTGVTSMPARQSRQSIIPTAYAWAPPIQMQNSNVTLPYGMQRLIDSAVKTLDRFWAEKFASYGKTYYSPDIVIYTSPIQTPCGLAQMNNAFYCSRSNTIYLDPFFLAEQMRLAGSQYGTDGDFAVVTIIAHEWAHAMQLQLGIMGSYRINRDAELAADTMAGAFAKFASQNGLLDPGDLDEATYCLLKGGDRIHTLWFDRQAHGSPTERINAFLSGFNGSRV